MDNNIAKIKEILRKNPQGLTTTNLVDKTELSRDTIRITIAKLEGAKEIKIRKIGMAKLIKLQGGQTWKEKTR